MMDMPLPLIKNVVLVGGGHAHALLLRSWAMKPVAGVRLTVINPAPTAPYTGMLPGFIAGHYSRDELDYDLVRLARFSDARFLLGIVSDIDRDNRTITVEGRPPIPYDICSINIGVTSAIRSLPGFAEHAIAAKPLGLLAARWDRFVDEAKTRATAARTSGAGTAQPSVAVIGGGVGGCELAMAMAFRLRQDGHEPNISVIDRSLVLDELDPTARREVRRTMTDLGVVVREHTSVDAVGADHVVTSTNGTTQELPSDLVIGAAGATPFRWVSELGLATTDGFIDVGPTLQTITDPNVFAVGDCAHLTWDPRPKAGVFAVREAPYLLNNIQALLQGRKLESYDPQADFLKLISLGRRSAGSYKFGRFNKGPAMWRLKDQIDKRFMTKLDELPEMAPPKIPKHAAGGLAEHIETSPPLCGGCGAKVGIDVLAGPLGALPASVRADVTHLPGDDAALLLTGGVRQVITTDQVRAFTTDPYRMARIAVLHALGDIWAMGADPQAVLVTVTLPHLGRGLQEEWLSEIMAGTAASLADTGAEVVGGHTSMGAELSLGYSITGLVDREPLTLAGARVGQRLVLTRPLGSGVLFAAEMRTEAKGGHVTALLEELERPQGRAARLITEAGGTAMTDVTGFGLAGHASGMVKHSGVGITLDLDAIPFFDGALEMSKAGVHSHLYEANAAAAPMTGGYTDPRTPLLYDPQTAGGLLCTVPADAADGLVAALGQAGFEHSAVVGTVTDDTGQLRVA